MNKRLIKLPEVLKMFGISKSTFYAGIKTKKFPAPIKITPKASVWLESSCEQVIDNLCAGAGGQK